MQRGGCLILAHPATYLMELVGNLNPYYFWSPIQASHMSYGTLEIIQCDCYLPLLFYDRGEPVVSYK